MDTCLSPTRTGGLSALVRQGADSSTITSILHDSYEGKFKIEEVQSAIKAAKTSEKTKNGTITRIDHEKFQPALDYFLFNMRSNLVITPTSAYVRGKEGVIEELGKKFATKQAYDEIWYVEGDIEEIEKEFRLITSI